MIEIYLDYLMPIGAAYGLLRLSTYVPVLGGGVSAVSKRIGLNGNGISDFQIQEEGSEEGAHSEGGGSDIAEFNRILDMVLETNARNSDSLSRMNSMLSSKMVGIDERLTRTERFSREMPEIVGVLANEIEKISESSRLGGAQ